MIGKWKKSLVNHLYWSASSTSNGNGDVMQAKWLSVDNHIHNVHKKHGKLFPKCKHKTLRAKDRKKKWFKRRKWIGMCEAVTYFTVHVCLDTKASEKVSARITNKSFCQDVKKMSPKYQTSACEAFHSVVIHFAPKSTAFSYKGMLSR